jgi:hypothetical protein
MTTFTTRMMIAAATVVAAAGVASAQTMRAEIPFTFRANGAVMTAGQYLVTLSTLEAGAPLLEIFNVENHRGALVRATVPQDPPKQWRQTGAGILSFTCGASRCSLSGVWNGKTGYPAYKLSSPKADPNEPVQITLVTLRSEKGD